MNIKIINGRLSFANHRTPYVSEPDPDTGKVSRQWNTNVICEDDAPIRYNGKDYTQTMVEYKDANGVLQLIPYTEFAEKVIPLVWAERGLPVPQTPYLNYAFCRADQTVGMRGPKIDPKSGEYYGGYTAETMFFFGKTDADKKPTAPIVVDQHRQPLDASSNHPVNGDYTAVLLSVYIYKHGSKTGMSASYNGMQYLREGEPFGAAPATADAFDEQEVDAASGDDENF